MLVLGSKEAQARKIALRLRGGKSLYGLELEEVVSKLKAEIAEKRTGSVFG